MRYNCDFALPIDGDDLIRCEILELREPTSFTCLMVVKLLDQNKKAMLKAYDRRFSKWLRRWMKAAPPTTASEEAYAELVKSVGAARVGEELDSDLGSIIDTDWDPAVTELDLHDYCLDRFDAETQTYHKLKHLQGMEIPYLIAEGRLQLSPSQESIETMSLTEDFFQVKAILMEFIDGYMMEDMPKHAPRKKWGDIVTEGVRIGRLIDDYSMLNEQFVLESFMVSPLASKNGEDEYRVVMLDFAVCRFRGDDEPDAEWGTRKWREALDESVWCEMQSTMKHKYNYDWPFTPSGKYNQWNPDPEAEEYDESSSSDEYD